MIYRDEFDDPPRSGLGFFGNVGPKAAFFIVLIALSFMIGVVWKLYVGGGNQTGQDIPIVRADDAPYKVAPDDPGGMDIPHRDSTIFSSLNQDSESRVENLLADEDEEEPMPRSQLFAGLNTEEPSALEEPAEEGSEPLRSKIDEMAAGNLDSQAEVEETVEGIIEETNQSVMPPAPEEVAEVAEPEKVEPVAEPAPTPKPVVEAQPEPKPAPKSTPAPTTLTTSSSGDYFVQLGSVKSPDGVESEWTKIVAKYPSILSGYNHRVETADLGDKGTFYRIQAGPVSKDKAVATCEAIKKIDPKGCLLKKK